MAWTPAWMEWCTLPSNVVLGGKVVAYDDKEALKVAGVQRTVSNLSSSPWAFKPLGGFDPNVGLVQVASRFLLPTTAISKTFHPARALRGTFSEMARRCCEHRRQPDVCERSHANVRCKRPIDWNPSNANGRSYHYAGKSYIEGPGTRFPGLFHFPNVVKLNYFATARIFG